jgi:hypothetical protein
MEEEREHTNLKTFRLKKSENTKGTLSVVGKVT